MKGAPKKSWSHFGTNKMIWEPYAKNELPLTVQHEPNVVENVERNVQTLFFGRGHGADRNHYNRHSGSMAQSNLHRAQVPRHCRKKNLRKAPRKERATKKEPTCILQGEEEKHEALQSCAYTPSLRNLYPSKGTGLLTGSFRPSLAHGSPKLVRCPHDVFFSPKLLSSHFQESPKSVWISISTPASCRG